LKRTGLEKRVRLTIGQDLINWYDGQSAADKTAIDVYIQQKTGSSVPEFSENDDQETVAQYLNITLPRSRYKR